MNRRTFIGVLAALTTLPKLALAKLKNPITLKPSTFNIPKLNTGVKRGDKTIFNLNVSESSAEFFNGVETKTWGINQNFMGETLKAKTGDNLIINVKNSLNEATTLHWHGSKLPAKADGGPHQAIGPNKTWQAKFSVIQNASTLWYHSHQMHKTGEQVYNGLAGMFIIDDDKSKDLNLPNEYGVDDIPVILTDKDFNTDGSFKYISFMRDIMLGKKGSYVMVNGKINPTLKAQKSLLRLRILNASNARIYNLNFGKKFHIIATDGGYLSSPIESSEVKLSPAERVEVLLEVEKDESITLSNKALAPQTHFEQMHPDSNYNIFNISGENVVGSTHKIPQKLITHNKIPKVDKVRKFNLQMQMGRRDGFKINGKSMDIARIDEVVKAESTEKWVIKNSSMMPHPFHIHNVQFKIISRSKSKLKNYEFGFKDTVLVNPNEEVRVVMTFPKYSDKNIPYMYHCHILEHEDAGMMGQFTVV